ncbi:MAG: hypothetical protein QNJ22_18720 [Desulfosarcinaceae bacterium]|nr:hypothetical protein [Desulfosarcinaceae bacterium]
MKRLGILLMLILVWSPLAHTEQTLVFGQIPGPVSRISATLLTEAYRSLGIAIKCVEMPLARSLVESNKGSVDGEVNRVPVIEPQYPSLLRVPVSINQMEIVVFSRAHDFEVSGWQHLWPYRIAIRKGAKIVEERTRGMQVFPFLSSEKMFTLVHKERYDLCISARINGYLHIKTLRLAHLRALEPPLETIKLYHYLHNKHIHLLPLITAALQKMEAAGRLASVREAFIAGLLPGAGHH